MAGVDTDIVGEARPQPGLNIGYLPQEPVLDPDKTVREIVEEPQEPVLDPDKTVREIVEESLTHIKEAQAELDKVYAAYAEPDADFDKLASRQAELENIITAAFGSQFGYRRRCPASTAVGGQSRTPVGR